MALISSQNESHLFLLMLNHQLLINGLV